jgi:hypothetical protein
MTRKLALTTLVALYLVFVLTALVALCYVAPLWTLVLIPAMAANGWMAADAVAGIWRLDDDGETV